MRFFKVLSFLGALALAYTASADPDLSAGRIRLGGSGAFYKSTYGDTLTLTPSADVFVIDRFSLGVSTQHGWSGSFQSHSLRPAAAVYLFDAGEAAFFIRQEAGWAWDSYQEKPRFDLSSGVGLDYFFNKNVSFTPSVSYRYGGGDQPSWLAQVGFNVFF